MNPSQGGWVILLTLAGALILTVVHAPLAWPDWLGWLRPGWVVLVVFFWVMELPHRIGLVSAWIVGLLVEVLYADPLGLNGLVLAAITYVTWKFYERLRMYSVLQQCGVVFLMVLAGEIARQIVQDQAAERAWTWLMVLPALVSMLLWPFIYILLQNLRVQFRIE